MQETCAFQTEASNAGYLATPTYCDPVDEGSILAADEASESDARYDGMSYLSSCTSIHLSIVH
ncbi:hypothetical protein DPMN_176625 [Dreissena polymorpha]|uniref:Uncharacterized protein n=1 Tax=Dreissena polymorpha TaxID=45954 RepID=A0A9D4EAH9_DREPO|nr:hypothetical protein DPMN_176625 [Dreissena polymorpha]